MKPKNLDWAKNMTMGINSHLEMRKVVEVGGLQMSGTYFMKMTNCLCEQCRVDNYLMAS